MIKVEKIGKKEGTDGGKYLEEDYENYVAQLSQKSGFVVVTPDDFNSRKPNADELKSLAVKHGADMIVVDQLSLMSDKRKADIPRIAYNNISEDLFLMSKELKKPVLLLAQAIRESVKNKKKGVSPELHDLAESDGVGQNATISCTLEDGYTWDAIREQVTANIEAYFLEIRKRWANEDNSIVRVSQVENRILNIEGVIDVQNTRLNNKAENFTCDFEAIPVLGVITNA